VFDRDCKFGALHARLSMNAMKMLCALALHVVGARDTSTRFEPWRNKEGNDGIGLHNRLDD
jgi:hypothetical protein